MLTFFGWAIVIFTIAVIGYIICLIHDVKKYRRNKERMEFYARRVARRLKWKEEHEGSN
jgi:hypothetical protein